MSKGGKQKQTTKVELDPAITAASRQVLDMANAVAGIGYAPYEGMHVAGFNPQQMMGAANPERAAQAFGLGNVLPTGADGAPNYDPQALLAALFGMNPGTTDPNTGITGYSAFPMMQAAVDQMDPEQRSRIEGYFENTRNSNWRDYLTRRNRRKLGGYISSNSNNQFA